MQTTDPATELITPFADIISSFLNVTFTRYLPQVRV